MCKPGNSMFRVTIADKTYRVYLKDVKFIKKLRKRKTPAIPDFDEGMSRKNSTDLE